VKQVGDDLEKSKNEWEKLESDKFSKEPEAIREKLKENCEVWKADIGRGYVYLQVDHGKDSFFAYAPKSKGPKPLKRMLQKMGLGGLDKVHFFFCGNDPEFSGYTNISIGKKDWGC